MTTYNSYWFAYLGLILSTLDPPYNATYRNPSLSIVIPSPTNFGGSPFTLKSVRTRLNAENTISFIMYYLLLKITFAFFERINITHITGFAIVIVFFDIVRHRINIVELLFAYVPGESIR